MLELTDKQIGHYFKRSYTAVDGLWFMKIEEKYGFDVALDIDDEVWKVLPKIQARMLKSMGGLDGGLDALRQCLTTMLAMEGFVFETEQSDDDGILTITLNDCPWHNVMIKSGREHLSEKVGTRICTTEYQVWASEFGDNINFELQDQICNGLNCCTLLFSVSE
jgi:predicted ArsR family transcriptional regulator